MDDVKELAKRIIIIDKGEIIYDGSLQNIINKYATHKEIEIAFSKRILKSDLIEFGKIKHFESTKIVLKVKRQDVPKISSVILEKFPVLDINIRELSLEDVVRIIFTHKSA